MEELFKNVERMAERVLEQVEVEKTREDKRKAIQSAILAIMFPNDFDRFVKEHKARSN